MQDDENMFGKAVTELATPPCKANWEGWTGICYLGEAVGRSLTAFFLQQQPTWAAITETKVSETERGSHSISKIRWV